MNQERDLARTHIAPRAPSHDDDLAPGRGSRSSQLDGPSHPIVGELIQRKARDANGVADGADTAVASAASSAGSSLPEPIMRKFESSLDSDLSNVRVHSGAESQVAAESVSAKAYTVGQDIHFAAGRYDPMSSDGEHLLAHEVAHTLQQQDSISRKAQFKLEVSSPNDSAEAEADRAADAMVIGAPAAVGASSGVGRQVVMRDKEKPALGSADDLSHIGKDGAFPDPSDPYEQLPNDFDAIGGTIPGKPGAAFEPGCQFAHPRPYINSSMQPRIASLGEESAIFPQQTARAANCQNAFIDCLLILSSSTTRLYPQVADYFDTDKMLKGDLGTLLGWQDVPNASDMGNATMQQAGQAAKVEDVFKNKQGQVGTGANVDLSKATTKSTELHDKQTAVNIALGKVKVAKDKYSGECDKIVICGEKVAQAVETLEIQKLAEVKDDLQGEIDKKKKEKDEKKAEVSACAKMLQATIKLAFSGGSLDKVADGVLSIGEVGINAVITDNINRQILSLQTKVKSATVEIDNRKFTLLNDRIATAQHEHDAQVGMAKVAEVALKLAAADAQTAYNDLAAVAGKSAGGEKANQAKVEASIRAIPKVQQLVGLLDNIKESCETPGWSIEAGVGHNASEDAVLFDIHYGAVKGYKAKFDTEATAWRQRLGNLIQISDSFGKSTSSSH